MSAESDAVKRFRELNELNQREFGEHLEAAIGLKIPQRTVSGWEHGKRRVPAEVLDYIRGGASDSPGPADSGSPPDAPPPFEDTPPRDPSGPSVDDGPPKRGPVKPLSVESQAYEKACVDLWQMIGFGVVIAGRGIRSPLVESDGLIIQAQADDLGKAYGKLAEQNDTFRRIILGLTQGGVWVEVTGVTVQLAMALAANHAAYGAQLRAARQQAADEAEGAERAAQDGAAAPHQRAA